MIAYSVKMTTKNLACQYDLELGVIGQWQIYLKSVNWLIM